jgi:hypothetical protein
MGHSTNTHSRAPDGHTRTWKKEWEISTNESWWSGCSLRCFFSPLWTVRRAIFVDQLTKESSSKSSSRQPSRELRRLKIEVNLCSIISSLSYLWSLFFSSTIHLMIPADDGARCPLFFRGFLLKCLSARRQSRRGRQPKGNKKKHSVRRVKCIYPREQEKASEESQRTEAINDSEGIKSDAGAVAARPSTHLNLSSHKF